MSKKSVEGIVVKVKKDMIVLLTAEGTFQNVALAKNDAPPLIGEHYTHIEKKVSWLKYTAIASVFLLAVMTSLLLPFGNDRSMYIVAIDINPSIELTVNEALEVKSANANNPDGEQMLAALDMKDQPLSIAIETLLTYSEEAGYFLTEKFLTASVIPVKKQNDDVMKQIEQLLENSASKPEIEAVVHRGNKADYKEAQKSNLSVNQHVLYKQLEDEGVVSSVEEVRGRSMAELRRMQNANMKEVPRGPEQNNSNRPENVGPPEKEERGNGNNQADEKGRGNSNNKDDKDRGNSPQKEQSKNEGKPKTIPSQSRQQEKGPQPHPSQPQKNAPSQQQVEKEKKVPPGQSQGNNNKNENRQGGRSGN